MAVSIALLVGTVYLFRLIPKGFLPSEDRAGSTSTPRRSRASASTRWSATSSEVADIVGKDPERRRRSRSNVGVGPGGERHAINGRLQRRARSRARERTLSVDEVIAELRPKLAQVPGIRVFLTNPPPINIGGQRRARLYQFTLQDTDTDELYQWAPVLEDEDARPARPRGRQQRPAAQEPADSTSTSTATRSPRSGSTVNQVETALYNAYGTRQVSQIYAPNNQYQVILRVAPGVPAAIRRRCRMLYVRSSSGPPRCRSSTVAHGDDRRRAADASATPASCRR